MNSVKSLRLAAVALAASFGLSNAAWAFRSGPPPGANGSTGSGGSSCRTCHGSAVGGGSVQVLGAPSAYAAGATYNLSVVVSDAARAGAGFQLSVEDAGGSQVGTLVITDATNTQLNSGWVNHTGTGVSNSVAGWVGNGNSATFNVDWVAPGSDIGPVTFWAAGNAINNNFSSSGDLIYLTDVSASFSDPVPAASSWGILTLVLVMLVSASVLLGRRRIQTVAVRG